MNNISTHVVYSQKYIYSPACHHEIQGHPNKVSRKEVTARAGFGPDRSGPGLQGTVDSFVGISILCRDTVSFNLIYICVL